MTTFHDQLREIERLLVKLRDKMDCQFEEHQDCFRPMPIYLEAAYAKEKELTPIGLEVDSSLETNFGPIYIEVLGTPSCIQEFVGVSQEQEKEHLRQIEDLQISKMEALEVLDFVYKELVPQRSTAHKSEKLEADKKSIKELTREIIPSYEFQVDKESSLDAYHLLDEMPMGNFDVFQTSKVIFRSLVVSKMVSVDSEMAFVDMGNVFDD